METFPLVPDASRFGMTHASTLNQKATMTHRKFISTIYVLEQLPAQRKCPSIKIRLLLLQDGGEKESPHHIIRSVFLRTTQTI